MRARQLELALRKQRLQLQCEAERAALAAHVAGLAPAFKVVDGTLAAVDWLRAQPRLLIGAAAAVMFLRPRWMWRWGLRGFSLWRLTQNLRRR